MAHPEWLTDAADPARPGGMSRRKLILGGATLAAAGVAAGAVGATAVSAFGSGAGDAGQAPKDLVVHVRDAGTGELLLLVGDKSHSFTNRDVAAELVRQSANAS
ncbi:MAG TPA: hypothetical protein VGX25_19695 [Actinophytocola sp.]|uniref:hypothetical protein n=1 Tax=Actinophytocola sp. TaxID=1872138 RepID=UPI002DDCF5C7|nr:hypothetical protein [Actinophytocola sp.]HEV2781613.1 hypothetical protein [Actinophytocola sp.]